MDRLARRLAAMLAADAALAHALVAARPPDPEILDASRSRIADDGVVDAIAAFGPPVASFRHRRGDVVAGSAILAVHGGADGDLRESRGRGEQCASDKHNTEMHGALQVDGQSISHFANANQPARA